MKRKITDKMRLDWLSNQVGGAQHILTSEGWETKAFFGVSVPGQRWNLTLRTYVDMALRRKFRWLKRK